MENQQILIRSFLQIYNNIMEGELTTQQFQTVLRFCDMLGIQDFTIGTLMLKQTNWNLQKAMGLQQFNQPLIPSTINIAQIPVQIGEQQAPKYQPPQYQNQETYQDQAINYQYQMNQNQQQINGYQYEYEYYKKQFERIDKLQKNKKLFNQGFQSIPLLKTKSEIKDKIQDKIKIDREICQKFNTHRLEYQNTLLDKSLQLCQHILSSKQKQLKLCYNNLHKNQTNRKFITYLHTKYNSKINFTFGTFLLNLTRSYLDNKYLLVYIHKNQFQNNKSITMLLQNKQIASVINKNCIAYGMFDNSDDYQILQKYVQMKDLPAFLLFKLDKKLLKEKFINVYPVLQSESENFLQWLANNMGIVIKKKQKKVQKSQSIIQRQQKNYQMSNIIYQQNLQYEQMARLYEMKRNLSKVRKESIEAIQIQIYKMKQNFKEEPQFQSAVSIQIRFRLPMTGNSLMRTFKLDQKIGRMFQYVHCFGRHQFQEKLANFDLTQGFPKLSLEDKKQMLISEVFGDSDRQNIIVKQL